MTHTHADIEAAAILSFRATKSATAVALQVVQPDSASSGAAKRPRRSQR